jgi:trimethylamine-N-oxide reductase (cytochrome c)
LFADILLPVNTKLEEDDIGATSSAVRWNGSRRRVAWILWGVRERYEVVCKIAERLGLLEEYTMGRACPRSSSRV